MTSLERHRKGHRMCLGEALLQLLVQSGPWRYSYSKIPQGYLPSSFGILKTKLFVARASLSDVPRACLAYQ